MKRAVFYARVSTSAQEEKGTIESQIHELKKQIEDDGNILIKEYVDNGYSGAKLDRPAMDMLRRDLKGDVFDVIYFLDADRIARNSTYQDIIISEILRYKKEIVIKGRNLLYDAEGKFKMTVLGAVSELERAKIIERSTRGKRERARRGQIFCGLNIYGYRYVKRTDEKPGHFVIDEKEAETVRFLFDTYANQEISLTGLIKVLEGKEIKTKKGNRRWARSSIKKILSNSTYYGLRYYNQSTRFEAYSQEVRREIMKYTQKDKSEWIAVKVPAIVNKDIFDKVQKKMKKHYMHTRKDGKKYLLSGLLKCGICGHSYIGYTHTCKKSYYTCNQRRKNFTHLPEVVTQKCDNPMISSEFIEGIVWNTIDEKILNPAVLEQYIEDLKDSAKGRSEKLKKEIKNIDSKIKEIDYKKERVLDLYADGSFSREKLDSKAGELENEEAEYQKKKIELYGSVAMIDKRKFIKKDIRDFCQLAKSRLDKFDFKQKKHFLLCLFSDIMLRETEITLNGYLPGSYAIPIENEEVNVAYCSRSDRNKPNTARRAKFVIHARLKRKRYFG